MLVCQFTLSRVSPRAPFGPHDSPVKVAGICRNHRIPGLADSSTPTLLPSQLRADRQCPRTTPMRNPGLGKLSLLMSPQQEWFTSTDCLLGAAMSCYSLGEWHLPCFIPKAARPMDVLWRNCLPGAGNNAHPCTTDCTIPFTKNCHTHL